MSSLTGVTPRPVASRNTSAHSHGRLVAARDHCLSQARAVDRPTGAARYGRMIPDLDPLDTELRLLMRAGGIGGICDASAVLDRLSRDSDDATEAAGWPFFGQLIAHDITAASSSASPSPNTRTASRRRVTTTWPRVPCRLAAAMTAEPTTVPWSTSASSRSFVRREPNRPVAVGLRSR